MSEPNPDESRSELLSQFNDLISRATKFLIPAAIILSILIIVVGQELREYRAKQAGLVTQIGKTTKAERALVADLQRQYRELVKAFPKNDTSSTGDYDDQPAAAIGVAPVALTKSASEEPMPTPMAAPPDGKLVTAEPPASDSVATNAVADELTEERQASKKPVITTFDSLMGFEAEDIPHKFYSVHKIESIRSLERQDEKLGALIKQGKDRLEAYTKDDAQAAESSLAYKGKNFIKALATYREKYQTRIGVSRELLEIKKQSEELKSAKKSIPTPFGNFQIAPKFALLGLAFAVILTYIPFLNWVRKIRGAANEYNAAVTGDADQSPLAIPAPFWSPDPQPAGAGGAQGWSSTNALLSILVHVVWIGLGLWLIVECLAVWSATKALAFEYRSFWGYLLVAVFAGVIIKALWPYVGPSLKRVSDKSPVQLNRRNFAIAMGVAVVGVVGVSLYRVLRKAKGPKLPRAPVSDYTTIVTEEWIQNKRTRVVHYEPICERHLPLGRHQEKVADPNKGVHASCRVAILAALGHRLKRDVSRDEIEKNPTLAAEGQLAIKYLVRAIQLSPLSLPLYDKLARTYGLFKSFDNILPLYRGGLTQATTQKSLFLKLPDSPRKEKKLKMLRRVEKEFQSRIERTEARKTKVEEAIKRDEESKTKQKDLKVVPGAKPGAKKVVLD
jgi:hypothetical protein